MLDGREIVGRVEGHMKLLALDPRRKIFNPRRSVVDVETEAFLVIAQTFFRRVRRSIAGYHTNQISAVRQHTSVKGVELVSQAGFQQLPFALVLSTVVKREHKTVIV